MQTMKIVTESLVTGSNELKELNQQFKSEISQLEGLEETLNGMWDGTANDTFHNAFNNDKIQMNNFYNAIEQYVATLNDIAARYQQAEQTNAEIARNRSY